MLIFLVLLLTPIAIIISHIIWNFVFGSDQGLEGNPVQTIHAPTDAPGTLDGKNDSVDINVSGPLLTVGKSPSQDGIATLETTSRAAGLGEGTPKVCEFFLLKDIYFLNMFICTCWRDLNLCVSLTICNIIWLLGWYSHDAYLCFHFSQSERSDDMFCDDIFGESPAGVRKLVCIWSFFFTMPVLIFAGFCFIPLLFCVISWLFFFFWNHQK